MKRIILFTTIIFIFTINSQIINQNNNIKNPPYISKSEFVFDTLVSITLYNSSNEKVLDQAFDLCQEYENKFSKTIPSSEISIINNSHGQPTKVSTPTLELLDTAIYYSVISNGAFDVTIEPLSSLWNFKKHIVPDPIDIQSASQNVNYKNIQLNFLDNTVTLSNPDTQIDLGGIAKGFIADQVKEFLLKNKIEHALINLGGNVLTINNKPNGHNFVIGIQKPFAKLGEIITTHQISDKSLVTSGIYERYFENNGQLYHHIIDPKTGYPCETDLYGVTIISKDSVAGDALSTICLIKGLDEGIAFIKSLDDISAIFIDDNFNIIYVD
ncbi:MAG: hypothetical protein ATN31_09530 [Candidatus Epulonipiscioides saccharophilum]|nr:MAG: hypothetical protein ATN31_09530 [Epulopiscium sp. AS2M-Bin001]